MDNPDDKKGKEVEAKIVEKAKKKDKIVLSHFTNVLMKSLALIKPKKKPNDLSKIIVSQTVSFLAFAYEKIRNAVEYREDHQIRRAAIERILKRRLMINPDGKGEAENLVRELLWARYFGSDEIVPSDVNKVQEIINKHLKTRRMIVVGRSGHEREYLNEFLMDLMTCEIEESLNPVGTQRNAIFTFFIYQVLRKKVKIEDLSENQKDAFFLAALEKTYRRSDSSYQRFHLFTTFYKPLSLYEDESLQEIASKLPKIFDKIDRMIKNPHVDHLSRFIKKQLPAFLILFDLVKEKFSDLGEILTNKTKLWNEVEYACRKKYQLVKKRLRNMAIRSFIYIFLTKMVFALILEFPVSQFVYGEVNTNSIIINSLFPPILMLLIVATFRVPGETNTKNIYDRIIDVIDEDKSFESSVALMRKRPKNKKPILIFGFTVFYSLTFLITLSLIDQGLNYFHFNMISKIIFVFFISLVTFFSYRIRSVLNEYRLENKQGILTPVFDFFFMPILSLGKFFSQQVAKINFFIFIFDFLIEAPFKFIFEIFEEWITYVRKRKEEIM